MSTSSACRLNRFQPAASRACSRSASVVSRMGSTAWMRKGSMMVVQRSIAGGYAALVGVRGPRAPGGFATHDAGCQTGPMQHIVLVGLMGSGKTTVGTLVAGRLGWPLRDSDADIAVREGRTVREIRPPNWPIWCWSWPESCTDDPDPGARVTSV